MFLWPWNLARWLELQIAIQFRNSLLHPIFSTLNLPDMNFEVMPYKISAILVVFNTTTFLRNVRSFAQFQASAAK